MNSKISELLLVLLKYLGLGLPLSLALIGCTYGPESNQVELAHVLAKPTSHTVALAVKFSRLRPPTGLSAFPDGGVPKYLAREGRIYVCDLDNRTVRLAARIPDYDGIPMGASISLLGWDGEALYFRLNGYGGSQLHGNDYTDPRTISYKLLPSGSFEKVKDIPLLASARGGQSIAPFLDYSKGYKDIEFSLDESILRSKNRIKIEFDAQTGEPKFTN